MVFLAFFAADLLVDGATCSTGLVEGRDEIKQKGERKRRSVLDL